MTNRLLLSFASFTSRLLPAPLRQSLYRLGPLTRFIRRRLNAAAPTGLTVVSVSAGVLQGARLSLDLQSEKDFWLGTYEPELQAAIAHFVKPGMVVYDVGANIGYISLMLSRAVGAGGQVFAFEPHPANLERLRANLALNPEASNVHLIPKAAADSAQPVYFLVHPSGGMGKAVGSAGRQIAYQDTISVPATSLDAFVYEESHPAPQIVKVDVEGGEILALPGMKRLLTDARPILLLELHGEDSAKLAWEMLTRSGYTLHYMKSGHPRVPSLAALDWKSYLVALSPQ